MKQYIIHSIDHFPGKYTSCAVWLPSVRASKLNNLNIDTKCARHPSRQADKRKPVMTCIYGSLYNFSVQHFSGPNKSAYAGSYTRLRSCCASSPSHVKTSTEHATKTVDTTHTRTAAAAAAAAVSAAWQTSAWKYGLPNAHYMLCTRECDACVWVCSRKSTFAYAKPGARGARHHAYVIQIWCVSGCTLHISHSIDIIRYYWSMNYQ